MSLTVPYAVNLCQQLSPLGLKWMEEYLIPDDYAGHTAVKDALKSVPTMLATAEHEYTRYGYKQLIDSGAVDLLQPDVSNCRLDLFDNHSTQPFIHEFRVWSDTTPHFAGTLQLRYCRSRG
jgi:hypothetical protein